MANEPAALRLHVRWMIRRDLPEVLAIEAQAFEYPWSEDDFTRSLRQRGCIGLVVEETHTERVAGFIVYEVHKLRLHVLGLAVAAAFRRQGVARAIVQRLQRKLGPRRSRMLLEIRETNLAAQLAFRRLGFRAIGVLRDFYDDTPEDAYLFEYRVPSSRFQIPGSRFQA